MSGNRIKLALAFGAGLVVGTGGLYFVPREPVIAPGLPPVAAATPVTGATPAPAVNPILVTDKTEISVTELQNLIADKAPFNLIDVRQPEEFEQGHIEGATLIPLADLPSRAAEVTRNKKVVVYCRSGARSAKAVELLKKLGYADVESLKGGFTAWPQEAEKK